jgi:hypothetical protein
MSYIVNTFDEVEEYLHTHADIPSGVRQRVIEGYLRDLAEHADDFLKRSPLAHESYTFEYDYLLFDAGFCYSFRFIADGSSMPFGIVQVIYVDFEKRLISG